MDITLRVNGATCTGSPEARKTLADFLRDDLSLTGTHVGCEHGVCGACTVIVDGRAVRSCLMLAVQAAGSEVTTIEGLASDGGLGPLQQERPVVPVRGPAGQGEGTHGTGSLIYPILDVSFCIYGNRCCGRTIPGDRE